MATCIGLDFSGWLLLSAVLICMQSGEQQSLTFEYGLWLNSLRGRCIYRRRHAILQLSIPLCRSATTLATVLWKERTTTTGPEATPLSLSLARLPHINIHVGPVRGIEKGRNRFSLYVLKGDIYFSITRFLLVLRSTRGDYAVLYPKHQRRERKRIIIYFGLYCPILLLWNKSYVYPHHSFISCYVVIKGFCRTVKYSTHRSFLLSSRTTVYVRVSMCRSECTREG